MFNMIDFTRQNKLLATISPTFKVLELVIGGIKFFDGHVFKNGLK